MKNRTKFSLFSIVALLFLSLCIGTGAAQYVTEKTTDFSIGSDGLYIGTEPDVGVTYEIQGTPGASGSVTAITYAGNPQATASCDEGIGLCRFMVITFDIDAKDFETATITFSYSDLDVKNIQPPYGVYKYIAESNSYIEIPATIDDQAKTVTITLKSTDDPLFAIGGSTTPINDSGSSTWIIAIAAIIIVIAVVLVVIRVRKARNIDF